MKPGIIEINDGSEKSYHENLNVTCTENHFKNQFASWKVELPKPLQDIQVKHRNILTIKLRERIKKTHLGLDPPPMKWIKI